MLLLDAIPVRQVDFGAAILNDRQCRSDQVHCALPAKTGTDTISEMRVGNLRHELPSRVLVNTRLYRDVAVYANMKQVRIDPESANHATADAVLQRPLWTNSHCSTARGPRSTLLRAL